MNLGRRKRVVFAGCVWPVGLALLTLACDSGPATGSSRADLATPASQSTITSPRPDAGDPEPTLDALADQGRLAYAVVDLMTDEVLVAANAALLDTLVAPGSIAKIPVAMAAFEAGVLDEQTALMCRRVWVSEGRRYVCSHPDLGRPMHAVDALAHSCNYFFATIATHLSRAAIEGAFVALGLPRPDATAPRPAIALGLEGVRATPRALLGALARVAQASRVSGTVGDARDAVTRGLREAAAQGTAVALGQAGIDAIAKTGTAPMPGGGFQGLVVAAWPSATPTRALVVVTPGGAGHQAAEVAAEVIRRQEAGDAETTLTLGIVSRHDAAPGGLRGTRRCR